MKIEDRLRKIVEYKKITSRAFALKIGISSQAFGNYLNGREPSFDVTTKIIETFVEISPDWLLTGKGSMFRPGMEPPRLMTDEEMAQHDREVAEGKWNVSTGYPDGRIEVVSKRKSPQKRTATDSAPKHGIPLVPLDAVAGAMSGNSTQIMPYDCDFYDIPIFRGADFLIYVSGDSMTPKYYSGDIIACKRLAIDTFFQWNKVYVVDSDQGVIVKRIRRGKDDDHLLLVSENPEYDPFELHRANIHSIALVMGLVRTE